MKKYLLSLLIAVVILNTILAQDKLRFEHITVNQGLADNTVLRTLQDSKGYIWISTYNGLSKYDGYNFINYQFDPNDSSSIGGNVISRVYEDKDGLIWVVVRGTGIYLFDRNSEKFSRFKPTNMDTLPLSISFSWGIKEDSEGKIWIGNDSDGKLFRYDKKTGRLDDYTPTIFSGIDLEARNRNIRYIYRDRSGILWIGSDEGLYRLNLINNKQTGTTKISFTNYRHDPENAESLIDNNIVYDGIYEDKAGMLWIGCYKGLNQFDPKTGKTIRYIHDPANPNSLSNNNITGIAEDSKGNLWISTTNGLNKLNKERTLFTHYFHDDGSPASISSNYVWSMFLDQKDILWIGTLGSGMDKVDLNQNPIVLYQSSSTNPNSLSNNNVTAVCEDRFGTVWIGTLGGGLNAWDRATNRFVHYRNTSSMSNRVESDYITAIIEDYEGNLWIGGG